MNQLTKPKLRGIIHVVMSPLSLVAGLVMITAARALGASRMHLVFKQILPNLWAPILVTVALNIPTMITAEAALTFLGAGVIDPTSDWGAMLLASVPFYAIDPTFTFIPGFALFMLLS